MRGGLVIVAVICAPGVAHAGRNFYGWLSDTDVMPERGVELQSWTYEQNHDKTDGGRSASGWGAAGGVVTRSLNSLGGVRFRGQTGLDLLIPSTIWELGAVCQVYLNRALAHLAT